MITRNGYEVVSEENYYKDIMGELKKLYPTMSENPANLLCILARMIARNENARDYDRVESYSNAYVATATGQALSKAVRTAGISRISGTKAIGKVTITKDEDVFQAIIPASMRVKSGNNIYELTSQNAIILNVASIDVEVISIENGTINNIPSGSKLSTVSNILGVKTIVAIEDIAGGSDVESDLALRERYYDRMNAYSNSSLKGIIDTVKAVPNVYAVSGDENNTNQIVGNLLEHSFIIYASGGTEEDIAKAIMHSKPAGVQTNGDISIQVDVSGRKHTIKFSRFKNQEVYYSTEIVVDKTTAPTDIIEIIQEKIAEYTLVNSKIVSYEISNYISQEIESVRGVKTILFGASPSPTTDDDLISESGTNFLTDASKIAVKVV
jgi:uncharacterized phage protein gp47/JayE